MTFSLSYLSVQHNLSKFFLPKVALCFTFQQGEDEFLSAHDAYWLGLIDEVIGDDSLLHLRTIKERADEPSPEPPAEPPLETAA